MKKSAIRKQKQREEWTLIKPVNRQKKRVLKCKRNLRGAGIVGLVCLTFVLFILFCGIVHSKFDTRDTWNEATFAFSHDKYISGNSRYRTSQHLIYGINGEIYQVPYYVQLDDLKSGDVITVQYIHWFFNKNIMTIQSDLKVFVSTEDAEEYAQSVTRINLTGSVVIGCVLSIFWIPIFIFLVHRNHKESLIYKEVLREYETKKLVE